uniref:Uncharacterized protein n=1 Tax=Rhizophora mucronata TaxID=61149 RepID=A0A2P2NA49_RHIMU
METEYVQQYHTSKQQRKFIPRESKSDTGNPHKERKKTSSQPSIGHTT